MRFVITGEWNRNRLLQVIVILYALYVGLLWITNALLYFEKMTLDPASVINYYLGNEDQYLSPRSYGGLLEVTHFHLFAMGMLLLVLTHLMLFIPVRGSVKAWLISLPFLSGLISEGASWMVRYGGESFAIVKVAGFLLLQGSLLALILISLWSVFTKKQADNYTGFVDDDEDDDDDFDD